HNLSRCFKNKELTFSILGKVCSRNCRFCGVEKSGSLNLSVDEEEPSRIAGLIRNLGINYAVITSVTRDDLTDGGAGHFARTIECIRAVSRGVKTEVLIPDFKADGSSIKTITDSGADVIAHNIETVRRLHRRLKPDSDYDVSLRVLRKIKENNPEAVTKSSFLLGLGETRDEVVGAMRDLKEGLCDILTLGQYLAPSPRHYPVQDFIRPQVFAEYRDIGISLGFRSVLSGPLVRSSYKASQLYKEVSLCMM
ncbi:MAG: lipoyl synthase, partial [Candidatus Omnitrophica bacterium]|nr:lipoyl synthase [Candidatus Omnitrophota bacterium]